jgi:hypothetical protein
LYSTTIQFSLLFFDLYFLFWIWSRFCHFIKLWIINFSNFLAQRIPLKRLTTNNSTAPHNFHNSMSQRCRCALI